MEEAVDETTALIQPKDTALQRRSYQHSVRRRSSQASLIPPYGDINKPEEAPQASSLAVWVVVPISLVGVFVAHADSSLVIASSQSIASEFNALSSAQWLVLSYGLAQCASQPLYGKLSDVFGRKSNMITAYTLFAGGCFLCGFGRTFGQVLAGRAISGVGGAGMTALVSVIITDMVPVRDVAAWRGYVNVAATTGRALGGPVGGFLTDTIGWRWCFYGQVPLTVIGLALILWKMLPRPQDFTQQTLVQKLRRVDVVGATLLTALISTLLIGLDLLAKEAGQLTLLFFFSLFSTLTVLFVLTEKYWAKEPILPLRLLVTRVPMTSYLLCGFQSAAQFAVFYLTPLYYQLAANSGVADSGARLVPAVTGNAVAGLLCGYVISKTGRYKSITVVASILAMIGYTLITLRWRGSTSWVETLYIFLGGFGSGALSSTPFVHLAASLELEDMAIAGTVMFSFMSIFSLVGIQLATTSLHFQLRNGLEVGLSGFKHRQKIIDLAISNIAAVHQLPEKIRHIVVGVYIDSLSWTFATSIIWEALALVAGLSIQERKCSRRRARFIQEISSAVASTATTSANATSRPLASTAATETPLTHYHSFFYDLLSWESPKTTAITFASVVLFILASRYLPIIRWLLKFSWVTLGVVTLSEIASKAVLGSSVASSFRPRRYYTIPKESLEATLEDVQHLVNFFVIEAQRIVFAENIPVTAAAFATAFASYFLIKYLPAWGLALLGTTVIFVAPLIYIKNQEAIDSHVAHATKVASAQATHIRQVAGQHAGKGYQVVKGYTGEYANKAGVFVGQARQTIPLVNRNKAAAAVKESDFPKAPAHNLPNPSQEIKAAHRPRK
ncbi:hypothetical protein DV738_g1697, partial [Chaetothyriales sp. CBS 135597]